MVYWSIFKKNRRGETSMKMDRITSYEGRDSEMYMR